MFFNQLTSPDLSVAQLTEALGDDREQIEVDLGDVPAEIHRIVVALYINDGPGAQAHARANCGSAPSGCSTCRTGRSWSARRIWRRRCGRRPRSAGRVVPAPDRLEIQGDRPGVRQRDQRHRRRLRGAAVNDWTRRRRRRRGQTARPARSCGTGPGRFGRRIRRSRTSSPAGPARTRIPLAGHQLAPPARTCRRRRPACRAGRPRPRLHLDLSAAATEPPRDRTCRRSSPSQPSPAQQQSGTADVRHGRHLLAGPVPAPAHDQHRHPRHPATCWTCQHPAPRLVVLPSPSRPPSASYVARPVRATRGRRRRPAEPPTRWHPRRWIWAPPPLAPPAAAGRPSGAFDLAGSRGCAGHPIRDRHNAAAAPQTAPVGTAGSRQPCGQHVQPPTPLARNPAPRPRSRRS